MGLIMAETLGFSGNGDPCNTAGTVERTKGVFTKPGRRIPMSWCYPMQSQFLDEMGSFITWLLPGRSSNHVE